MSLRLNKVNSELRKQLMDIIQKEIDDPDLEFLSITRVDVTADLREAKVYFSVFDESKYKKAKEGLAKMNGLIRGILGKRIRLKFLPQLTFIPDDSMKYSVDIYKRIEEIKKEEDEQEDIGKNNR